MTDRGQDKKLEDVLSSVRRLVSNELPRAVAKSTPGGGALVLTSAQRVQTAPPEESGAKSLEERIAELEAAVSERADEFEPDGSEDQAQHRPDRVVISREPRLTQLSLVDTDTFEERDDEQPSADEAPMAENVEEPAEMEEGAPVVDLQAFQDPDAMLERVTARWSRAERGEAEPAPLVIETSSSDTESEPVVESAQPEQVEEPEPQPAPEPEAEVAAAEPEPEFAPMRSRLDPAPEDEEFEAALAAAVTASLPSVIADSVKDAVLSRPKTEPGSMSPDPALLAETEQQPAESPFAPVAEPAPTPETAPEAAIPDKEALRPLVAELIREELQGEMGERITRNVRKLVRREILRAQNSRELE